MATTHKIFIVDSDSRYRCMLEEALETNPSTIVFPFYSAEDCINVMESEPDVVIIDMHLESLYRPVMSGLDLLKHIKANYPSIDCIVISSDDTLQTAQQVAALAPFDFVLKTETNLDRLNAMVQIILRHKKLEENVSMYRNTFYLVGLFIGVCLLSAGCAVVF